MPELTSEEFRQAVAAAIAGVEHLYREVDLMIASLREKLSEDPDPLTLKRGTLGKAGKKESKRVVVRHEYGALFEPAFDEDDDLDEDDDSEEDEEDLMPASGKRRRRHHEIVASQPLLAVRVAMYDSRKQGDFEPQMQFAVMAEWALGDSKPQPDERFVLQAYMLKRLSRSLADRVGSQKGTRIRTAAAARTSVGRKSNGDRKLTCTLPAGVESVPLYQIDSVHELEKVAARMKRMWASVVNA